LDTLTAQLVGCLLGSAALLAALASALLLARLLRDPITHSDVEQYVDWRLVQLLPVPYLGDRTTLLSLLEKLAPGRPLALYAVDEPHALVAQRHEHGPPAAAEACWIEIHRALLSQGRVVVDERCGTIVPTRDRDGRLRGALIIGGSEVVILDAEAQATLRHIAGILHRTVAADARSLYASPSDGPAPARFRWRHRRDRRHGRG
jgi:hypothetical protein